MYSNRKIGLKAYQPFLKNLYITISYQNIVIYLLYIYKSHT